MNEAGRYDLTKLALGANLLLQNAFRLAQLPVDASERQLGRRQKMLETAAKMGLDTPPGDCPIWSAPGSMDIDTFREVMHRLREPINRLLDEIFWFWPEEFGASRGDEGLQRLARGETAAVIDQWLAAEKASGNLAAIHNLALFHQFVALQVDLRLAGDESHRAVDLSALLGMSVAIDKNVSEQHWREALGRWHSLEKREAFWQVVRDRVRAINDPRLPPETVAWLRESLPSIIFSLNAELIVGAAEKGLPEWVKRQHAIIRQSTFEAREIEAVFASFTQRYVYKIQHLVKMVEDSGKSDPRRADRAARNLVEQATPILETLSAIFPDGNSTINTLHDTVAECLLICQVAYARKTEDWKESLNLLQLAQPIARGGSTRSKIEENKKTVQDNQNAADDWCLPGYFDLPEPCIEHLEKARAFADSGQFESALDLLRQALLGFVELPPHPQFEKYLHHGLAYNFKRDGIGIYNRALAEFNNGFKKIFVESVTSRADSALQAMLGIGGDKKCVCCGGGLYGTYVNRTFQNLTFPYCMTCSNRMDNRIKDLEKTLDEVTRKSLDRMVLATAFDPDYQAAQKNLKIIKEAADKRGISSRRVDVLKENWNLIGQEEMIAKIVSTSDEYVRQVFVQFMKSLATLPPGRQNGVLDRLFAAVVADGEATIRLLPHFQADKFVAPKFEAFVLRHPAATSDQTLRRLHVYLLGSADQRVRSHALDTLLQQPEEIADLVLLASGTTNAHQAAQMLTFFEKLTTNGKAANGALSFSSLRRSLLAARHPDVSTTLLSYCDRTWPDYDRQLMDKRSLRDLKYLEKRGEEQQRRTARRILDKARGRGLWARFKVWQWRPAEKFAIAGNQEIWWSRDN